ncbi:hypothetical protein Cme02nite_26080 [Catellatospora methionotrophica]|uniref:Uncharacterized protein n=1 Tax=Catellatospora methionotrophica TaxID=121620 RepID=A0A8J3PGH1_9ACTN|nr:hypothetical protein [Catellatospora methionotrophica]GIG14276.1 hypothetical protein Cme02nite_26080 [Catellatospora methionotrophica]
MSAAADVLAGVLLDIEAADTSYGLRAALVIRALHLAVDLGYPAGIGHDPHGLDGYRVVVYIDLPGAGQCSWHMREYPAPWDGHSTADKYARIHTYANAQPNWAGQSPASTDPKETAVMAKDLDAQLREIAEQARRDDDARKAAVAEQMRRNIEANTKKK